MNDKVKEVQEYLEKKEIAVTEDEIIDTAIKIATRFGDKWVFVCEFKKEGKR